MKEFIKQLASNWGWDDESGVEEATKMFYDALACALANTVTPRFELTNGLYEMFHNRTTIYLLNPGIVYNTLLADKSAYFVAWEDTDGSGYWRSGTSFDGSYKDSLSYFTGSTHGEFHPPFIRLIKDFGADNWHFIGVDELPEGVVAHGCPAVVWETRRGYIYQDAKIKADRMAQRKAEYERENNFRRLRDQIKKAYVGTRLHKQYEKAGIPRSMWL